MKNTSFKEKKRKRALLICKKCRINFARLAGFNVFQFFPLETSSIIGLYLFFLSHDPQSELNIYHQIDSICNLHNAKKSF